jgi:hypothetical protein
MEHPDAASRHFDGGFYAIDFFLNHSFARSFVIGRPGSAIFRNEGRNNRSSSAASRSAANFRTLADDAACTSGFHASGKRTGVQRQHICARHTAAGEQWSRPERAGPRRLYKNGESGPVQHSRSRD